MFKNNNNDPYYIPFVDNTVLWTYSIDTPVNITNAYKKLIYYEYEPTQKFLNTILSKLSLYKVFNNMEGLVDEPTFNISLDDLSTIPINDDNLKSVCDQYYERYKSLIKYDYKVLLAAKELRGVLEQLRSNYPNVESNHDYILVELPVDYAIDSNHRGFFDLRSLNDTVRREPTTYIAFTEQTYGC